MRIELQWAFTDADIPRKPCALCEIEFEGKAVIIRCDPHSYEVCEDCLRALDVRKEQEDGAPWPSWGEYEDLVESHPEPMFESDEAMDAAGDVVAAARAEGLFTTLTLATSFGCPFEGEISPDRVLAYAERGAALGSDELCLADTIGVGTPNQVRTFTTRMRTEIGSTPVLRYHFHNTRGTGIANAYAALLDGVNVLDASAGGIGGCPFAPNATGNIATDDLVYLLDRMGLESGIDLERLMPTSAFLAVQLGHEVPALLPRAGNFPPV